MSEKTSWGELFAAHLAAHRRLVIPGLGALVVKEPDGQIVFSELLRRDDDRLRSLLLARGMSEVEAAGAIDRLVFEVRHAVGAGRAFLFEGFGTLSAGENGAIVFKEIVEAVPEEKPEEKPREEPVEKTPKGVDNWRRVTGEEEKNLRTPDPSVKGLQYGRPQKNTQPYTYVGRKTRRRVDAYLVIALIVAALAISAIIYGYVRRPPTTEEGESVSLLERWGLVSPKEEPTAAPAAMPAVIDYGPNETDEPAEPATAADTTAAPTPAQTDAW